MMQDNKYKKDVTMLRRDISLKLLYLLLTSLLIACSGDGYEPNNGGEHSRGDLVSASTSEKYDVTDLQTRTGSYKYGDNGLDSLIDYMLHDVKTYKITYWTTDADGNLINASGLLAIPQHANTASSRLVVYHHGTIFHTAYAPSNSSEKNVLASILASMDFIVMLPDYIGYGESVAQLHPYMHAATLASSSIDLIRAARFFMQQNGIASSNDVLLGGYSEGGYAAMATHRSLETDFSEEFDVIASYPGAGAYDLLGTATTLLSGDTLPSASYVAFLVKAYDEVYNVGRIDEIFNPLYVDVINSYFYGNYDSSVIEDKLIKDTASLFDTTFLNNFKSAEGEADLKLILSQNNVYDWSPLAPVRLFHGEADLTVPYTNGQTALDTMNPDRDKDIEIVPCEPLSGAANHNNCYLPYLISMTEYFLAL